MPAIDVAPEVTVVVPVFGNAATIAELVDRLRAALADRHYELLFVDDASHDDSSRVVRALAEEDRCIRGIVLAENVGQNSGAVAGLADAGGEAVVVMDADLQDPPEAVPLLLDALNEGEADVVFAARRGRYESVSRRATSRGFKWFLWALTRGRVPPDAGLFLAMRQPVVERVLARAGSDPYLVVLAAHAATGVTSVPVARARGSDSSYTGAMRRRVARRAIASVFGRDSGAHRYRVADRIGRASSTTERM